MENLLNDLVSLFYPELCSVCRKPLIQNENHICLRCLFEIPGTNYELSDRNPVMDQLKGIASYENAFALYLYSKFGTLKTAIHAMKYKGNRKIGFMFGELLGEALRTKPPFCTSNFIIPVPLHDKRLKIRGYNQSKLIADGVASKMGIPVCDDILLRNRYADSQTRKDMWERELSSKQQFELSNKNISEKNILIIDDIITTGSTLAACSNAFIGMKGIRLFAAAVAFTKK